MLNCYLVNYTTDDVGLVNFRRCVLKENKG